MDYSIFETVTVPDDEQEDVASGHVVIAGREVVLIAQDDFLCTFAVQKRTGNLLWIDQWIDQPREEIECLVEKFSDDGADFVSNSYCNGYIIEMPFRNRGKCLAAFRRLPNHAK